MGHANQCGFISSTMGKTRAKTRRKLNRRTKRHFEIWNLGTRRYSEIWVFIHLSPVTTLQKLGFCYKLKFTFIRAASQKRFRVLHSLILPWKNACFQQKQLQIPQRNERSLAFLAPVPDLRKPYVRLHTLNWFSIFGWCEILQFQGIRSKYLAPEEFTSEKPGVYDSEVHHFWYAKKFLLRGGSVPTEPYSKRF